MTFPIILGFIILLILFCILAVINYQQGTELEYQQEMIEDLYLKIHELQE